MKEEEIKLVREREREDIEERGAQKGGETGREEVVKGREDGVDLGGIEGGVLIWTD